MAVKRESDLLLLGGIVSLGERIFTSFATPSTTGDCPNRAENILKSFVCLQRVGLAKVWQPQIARNDWGADLKGRRLISSKEIQFRMTNCRNHLQSGSIIVECFGNLSSSCLIDSPLQIIYSFKVTSPFLVFLLVLQSSEGILRISFILSP